MRDLILAAVMVFLLPQVFRRPAIGVLLWAWVSIMNPHQLTYGFAATVPWAMITALLTLTAMLFAKQRPQLPMSGGVVILLVFMTWMTVTSVFAMNPNSAAVWDRWLFMIKGFVMLIVTIMILRGRKEIEWLIWVIVVSLAYYGVKGGIFTALTGGEYRVWGPPGGMIEGNNELAVALIIIMPWMYYLLAVNSNRIVRLFLLACLVFSALAVLGTHSRGALLAISAMAFLLAVKSEHPVRSSLILVLIGLALVGIMSEAWVDRMETISTYEEDNSAMQRIWTWTSLWQAALDNPLFGVGFRADNAAVFDQYGRIAGFESYWGVYTPVAHSSYMQALGEHGFIGLFLFLALGVWTWFAAKEAAVRAQGDAELSKWVPLLMKMCQVSLAGFAVGGAFLSLMLFDVPYYIAGVVVLVRACVDQRVARASKPRYPTTTMGG